MLTFDLKKLPPSKEEIEAERVYLERELVKNTRRRALMIVLFFLIPLAAIAASWQFGLVDDKTAMVIAVVAGFIAIACAATGAGVGVVVCAAAGAAVGVVVCAATGAGVGAVIGAIIGAIATGILERLHKYKTNLEKRLASLSGLEQQKYMHRCPAIFQACQKDADCEAYRLAVAKLGRALTVAEADMMEVWVDGTKAREEKKELARVQQVACAMLRRTEVI